jgi:hypothetical protein
MSSVRRLTVDDFKFVKDIMLHDDVFKWICDDGTKDKHEFEYRLPVMMSNDCNHFLSPGEGCVFFLQPFCTGTYTVHTCIIPSFRGRKAVKYGRETVEFIFEKLPVQKIISYVPGYNRKAVIYSFMCGFKKEGEIREAWRMNGISYNLTIVGITKGEWLCQQQQ